MARVFTTGSSDGLGLMAGKLLIEQGHEVVLHGRNQARTSVCRDCIVEEMNSDQRYSRRIGYRAIRTPVPPKSATEILAQETGAC